MENRAHALAAILFLLLLGLGGAYLYAWMRGPEPEDRIYRVVTTQSVGSLRAHSEVTYKGLVAGHVRAVELHPEDPDRVVIELGVREGVPVTESTYAEIATRGITGASHLALEKDPEDGDRPLATSPDSPGRIPLREGTYATLLGNAREVAEQMTTLTRRLNRLVDEGNRERVAGVLDGAVRVLDRVEALSTALRPGAERVEGVLAETDRAVRDGRHTLARIRELAGSAREEVGRVGTAARSWQRLGEAGREAVAEGEQRLLPRVDALAGRFDRIAASLEELSALLREQPQAVIYGPPAAPPGPGEEGFEWPDPGGQR
ncbi:MAG: MlaD family protein [Thiohalorhabdus sp.]|uniref:MlaD family protein n=1 Tax=Thiohalorhabdus sp. TaxID=3094134 RepID=UPI00397F11C6